MRMVRMQRDKAGDIWLNPEAVATVQRASSGSGWCGTVLTLLTSAFEELRDGVCSVSEVCYVEGHPDEVAWKLQDPATRVFNCPRCGTSYLPGCSNLHERGPVLDIDPAKGLICLRCKSEETEAADAAVQD